MNKLGRIITATVLCCSLTVTPVFAEPATGNLEEQREAAQNEADALQEELVTLLDKIGQLEEDLITTGEKITQAEADLAEAEELAEEQYESMKLRIKYMYENGTTDTFETLVSAENFSDLVNKATYIAEVHIYDRNQLNEYIENKEKIENLKDELVEEQSQLQATQTEFEQQEETLTSTLDEKRNEIAGFDAQIQAAAEEAARLAQERQARQENSSNNGSNAGSSNSNASNSNTSNSNNSTSNGSSNSNNNSSNNSSGNTNTTPSTPAQNPSGNTAKAQAIVNAAYSQLGVPYVLGGTSSSGWDCSGLVQYCHSVAGISLPRTSQSQGGCGVAVSSPQPGDIVCYGTHVGIYIGNGKMIHAPKPGDVVKVAAVYGSPWYRRCW